MPLTALGGAGSVMTCKLRSLARLSVLLMVLLLQVTVSAMSELPTRSLFSVGATLVQLLPCKTHHSKLCLAKLFKQAWLDIRLSKRDGVQRAPSQSQLCWTQLQHVCARLLFA